MPVSTITHKGKEIIFIDNSGLSGETLLENMRKGTQAFFDKGSGILALADFSMANLSKEVIEYLKNEESKKAAEIAEKQAVIGITGIKKMILNIYNTVSGSNTKVCNSREEAMEYLVG